jgi:hypothetical protein
VKNNDVWVRYEFTKGAGYFCGPLYARGWCTTPCVFAHQASTHGATYRTCICPIHASSYCTAWSMDVQHALHCNLDCTCASQHRACMYCDVGQHGVHGCTPPQLWSCAQADTPTYPWICRTAPGYSTRLMCMHVTAALIVAINYPRMAHTNPHALSPHD